MTVAGRCFFFFIYIDRSDHWAVYDVSSGVTESKYPSLSKSLVRKSERAIP